VEYVPIVMVFAFALVVAGAMMWLPALVAPRRQTRVKAEPFECGKDPLALPEGRFAIKFSTVAIFFIIFDIEVMLIFPWAVQVRPLGWPGYFAMLVFLGILMLGFLYMWKKGGLEWE
jgi:NADH-quinone oxidoreductase subunit A